MAEKIGLEDGRPSNNSVDFSYDETCLLMIES